VVIVKLVIISDTHNQIGTSGQSEGYRAPRISRLELPEGDVLIHCGDHTASGKRSQLEKGAEWLGGYKDRFRHILAVAGNHDFVCEDFPTLARKTFAREGIKYLCDSRFEIDGVLFYGSPWQPWFYDWAFNFPQINGDTFARSIWSKVPDATNVLITHGPPSGILDKTYGGEDTRAGCPFLRGRIEELEHLKVHAFGHIHEQNGKFEKDGVTFINAAICDRENYAPKQRWHEIEI
jgi:Icc-related predicted phosphoesterase